MLRREGEVLRLGTAMRHLYPSIKGGQLIHHPVRIGLLASAMTYGRALRPGLTEKDADIFDFHDSASVNAA